MGVYVKDMEMPRGCIFCPLYQFSIYRTECVITGNCIVGSEETGRNPDCPLVEVPVPHGNLIDTSQSVECMFWDGDKEKWVLKSTALSEMLSMTVHSEPVKIAIPKEDAEHDEHGCDGDSCPIEGVE